MKSSSFAQLKTISPFFPIFAGGRIPIQSPKTREAQLVGSPESVVYMVDFERITPLELGMMIGILIGQFHAPEKDIRRQLSTSGLPIRASNVEGVI